MQKKLSNTQPETILVAVSGGVDSMVMLHQLKENYNCIVAHVNFGLRGDASNQDELLVKTYCKKYNLELECLHADTAAYMKDNNMAVQEAARHIRYNWFAELYKKYYCTSLAVAHHQQDQIETFLIKLARGAGLKALIAMQANNELLGMKIIRPLITLQKKEILSYAENNQIEWREDASNQTSQYTRNAIRNKVLPMWESIEPRLPSGLVISMEHLHDAQTILQQHITHQLSRLLYTKDNIHYLSISLLQKTKFIKQWLFYALEQFNFESSATVEVEKLLTATNGKYYAGKEFQVIKHNKHLIISPINKHAQTLFVIEENASDLHTPSFNLSLSIRKEVINNNPKIAQLNLKKIEFPLIVRPWQAGDYFYPLGLGKKKKISKFLIDNKLNTMEKEKVWVLVSNQKIVWVIGMRMDERFKVKTHKDLNYTAEIKE
jgi:tRNA(Ile)-lysidine synthase